MSHELSRIFNLDAPQEHFGVVGSIRRLDNNPLIVEANELSLLLNRDDCVIKHTDKPLKVVRFLLRTNQSLVFGAEGRPKRHIPAHCQMAGNNPFTATCIAAGNAFFDEHQRLCAISNQSGDFRPSFDSLRFALNAFKSREIHMAEILILIKIDMCGRAEATYSLNTSEISTFTAEHFETITSPTEDETPYEPRF